MPVKTRSAGPPATPLPLESTRKRRPAFVGASTQTEPSLAYVEASTQTEPSLGYSGITTLYRDLDLTILAATTPKRRIEAVDEPETAPAKRQAASEAESLRRALFPPRRIVPAEPSTRDNATAEAAKEVETVQEDATPSVKPATVFGRVLGGFKSWMSPQKVAPTPERTIQPRSVQTEPVQRNRTPSFERIRTREERVLDLRRQARDRGRAQPLSNKRSRKVFTTNLQDSSTESRTPMPAREEREEEVHNYSETTEEGTNKRKRRDNTFGFSYDEDYYSDTDEQASARERATEDTNTSANGDTEVTNTTLPSTPARNIIKATGTPLKSALKSIRSNGKTVSFFSPPERRPFEDVRKTPPVYGGQGPAGHYRGGVFGPPGDQVSNTVLGNSTARANLFSDTPNSPNDTFASEASTASEGFSPATMQNTQNNATATLPAWLVNRGFVFDDRRGFHAPNTDYDDPECNYYDPDDDSPMIPIKKISTSPATQTPVPAAPRPAHAELPDVTPTNNVSDTSVTADETPTNTTTTDAQDGTTPIESTQNRASKMRQNAQKHLPKQPSRLSQVEPARSRSSSPPATEVRPSEHQANEIRRVEEDEVPDLATDDSEDSDDQLPRWDAFLQPPGWKPITTGPFGNPQDPLYALGRPEDDTFIFPDGMTEKQRMQNYTDYWIWTFTHAPCKTYEEAGFVNPYIDEQIDKHTTEEEIEADNTAYMESLQETSDYIGECREQGVKSTLTGGGYDQEAVLKEYSRKGFEKAGWTFKCAPWEDNNWKEIMAAEEAVGRPAENAAEAEQMVQWHQEQQEQGEEVQDQEQLSQ